MFAHWYNGVLCICGSFPSVPRCSTWLILLGFPFGARPALSFQVSVCYELQCERTAERWTQKKPCACCFFLNQECLYSSVLTGSQLYKGQFFFSWEKDISFLSPLRPLSGHVSLLSPWPRPDLEKSSRKWPTCMCSHLALTCVNVLFLISIRSKKRSVKRWFVLSYGV